MTTDNTVPLTEREKLVLYSLSDQWVRPMDIGGTSRSHHSSTLKQLVRKGLVESKRRGSLMNALGSARGSYVYRLKENR